MFEHPAKLIASGAAALRERFQVRFKEPNLHAHLLNRVVLGSTVIEPRTGEADVPEGPGTVELVMIYEVRDGQIAKAWVMAGAATVDGATKTGRADRARS
jgi:hypothetical protein